MSNKQHKHFIIIAEDDEDDRELFREALGEESSEVSFLFVGNGRDLVETAMNLPADHLPCLIIVDQHMPLMSGEEAANILTQNNKTKDIPLVLLSTSINSRQIERCKKMGIREVLVKSWSMTELRSSINQLLSYCHGAKDLRAA